MRSQTNAIRLVDAKEIANAKLLSELLQLASSHREASAARDERAIDKLDLLIDVARDSRADTRQVLAELRAQSEQLGVQRSRIEELLQSDRYTPTHVPLPPREDETRSSPPEGISVHRGKITASFGLASLWTVTRKAAPWAATTGIGAALSHLLHRLHLFGL